jgi:hypothetical protein
MSETSLHIPGLKASADLSAAQFRCVQISAAFTVAPITNGNAQIPIGVLQNDPDAANEAAEVIALGASMVEAGASFSAGDSLVSDNSGRLITGAFEAAIGTADLYVVGRALEAAGAAGDHMRAWLGVYVPGSAE